MWGQPFHLAARRAVDAGELPGPRIVTASPMVDGPWPRPTPDGKHIVYRSVILDDPADAAGLARAYRERGYDFIKAYSSLTADTLTALGKAAAAEGLTIAGHCPDSMTFEQAADAGMVCIEHLYNIYNGGLRDGGSATDPTDAKPAHVDHIAGHLDWDRLRRLADRFAAEQIWNCPTNVPMVAMPSIAELDGDPVEAADEYLAQLSPVTATGWKSILQLPVHRQQSDDLQVRIDARRRRDNLRLRVLKMLHDHGAPLLVGTDAPVYPALPGRSVHDELRSFVRAGLTPYEALRCATAEPARFLERDAELGTVEVGKYADLLLLNANPLDEVGAVADLAAVLVNGYLLSRATLDELLATRSADMAAELPAPALPPQPEAADCVRRGQLVERRAGVETGRLGYAHYRSPDGGWIVDEAERSHTRQRTTRLWLGPAGTLRSADVTAGSTLGRETTAIRLTGDDQYDVSVFDVDGVETTTVFGDHQVRASDTLALTGMLVQLDPGPANTIGADGEAVEPHTLQARCADGGGWEITVDHPREPTVTYQVTLDGDDQVRRLSRQYVSEFQPHRLEWTAESSPAES
jgi:amidohydrolase family protein